MTILIDDNGIVAVDGKYITTATWKKGDCVSKRLVLAANAVRLEEKRRKR